MKKSFYSDRFVSFTHYNILCLNQAYYYHLPICFHGICSTTSSIFVLYTRIILYSIVTINKIAPPKIVNLVQTPFLISHKELTPSPKLPIRPTNFPTAYTHPYPINAKKQLRRAAFSISYYQTNSIMHISAASPLLGPVLIIRQ